MMSHWKAKGARTANVRTRAKTPNAMYGYCHVVGCPNPARAGTTDGLDQRFCRNHYDHFQRHGSAFKSSYRATDLNPYRQSALVWLLDHPNEIWVRDAIGKIEGLYRKAGPYAEAFRLRGLSPQERARAHWARLRKHEIDPYLPVAAWMAVEMILKDDPQPDWHIEFKRVQAAKLVHRMASGTHKRWTYGASGKPEELHAYPRSRGRVLRHVGHDLGTACELLSEHHLEDVHRFKQERDLNGATYTSSPYPKGWSARKRSPKD